MGVIVEKFSDDKGLVWPKSVAPFQVHLLSLGVNETADKLYAELEGAGIEVLYDDRDASVGEKFSESDLLGIPLRIVIGKRSLESGKVEVKERTNEVVKEVTISEVVAYCRQ